MYSMESKPVPSADVIVTELEGEAVLLHLQTRFYFTLNSTGLWLWKQMTDQVSLKELADRLQTQFELTASHAEATVRQFLKELQSEDLVKVDR